MDSSIIEFFIRIGAAVLEVCGLVNSAQEDMTRGSRLGESRMDRESRQWFRRVCIGVVLGLGLLMAILCWWR
jgi:hypothetical protein